MSKVEFALRSFPIEHLQKALHVSCGKGNDELQFGQFLRVVRDVPFISNTESPGIARIQDSDKIISVYAQDKRQPNRILQKHT